MWRTMKLLRSFTASDVAHHAGIEGAPVARATAQTYLRFLDLAGYVVVAQAARAGSGAYPAVYRLVKNTGPQAPLVTKQKHVFDANLGQVVWPPRPAEATHA